MKGRADKIIAPPHPTRSLPWFFFVLVFCWTWFFWIWAAILGAGVQTSAGKTLLLMGLLGPTLGGIGFSCLRNGKENAREYWLRVIDPKRIRPRWYLVIVFLMPVLMAIAVLLDAALGEETAPAQIGERAIHLLSAPLTILPFALRVLLYGPLTEELGWRGYALDRLQARWNAITSALILGTIWAAWHLPLFFIPEMPHYTHGAWSTWFWLFMGQTIALAVIFTWIFNNTRRSTLGAILFHFMVNATYELASPTDRANLYAGLLLIITAVALIAAWGTGRLTRGGHTPSTVRGTIKRSHAGLLVSHQ